LKDDGEVGKDTGMGRKLRIVFEGAIYHVTIRGNGRQEIFRDDGDRGRFLEQLSEQTGKHGVRLYLYCLMSNHVHLLVETPRANISRFMQSLMTAYTMYFNRRHRRVGHLLQGRFGGKPVEGDEYLLRLSRYVHLNPVHVGGAERRPLKEQVQYLRGYRWSSYPAYAGRAKGIEGLEMGPVLAQVPGRKGKRAWGYRKFVESGLGRTDEEVRELVKGASEGIGGEGFLGRMREIGEGQLGKLKRPEDTTFRKQRRVVAPKAVVETITRVLGVPVEAVRRRSKGQVAKGLAALLLSRHSGLTQREVAQELGLKWGSAVSWQVRRVDRLAKTDKAIRGKLEQAERSLGVSS